MNLLTKYGAGQSRMDEAAAHPNLALARVLSQSVDLYRIATAEAEYLARVSGKFRHEAADAARFPAAGDYVLIDPAPDGEGQAVIQKLLPRSSAFLRAGAGGGEAQVVAANIDLALICMALDDNYNLNRLERYLSVAWDSGATPAVALTKADLCPDLADAVSRVERCAPGTAVLTVSNLADCPLEPLQALLGPGVTGALLGSSGVGKSTLINRLLGNEAQDTGEVRRDGKGRHTTTRRDLIALPWGGVLIDTPGMRELGVESADLVRTFPDIDALAEKCRFSDCTHTGEPGCAVQRAIQTGLLEQRRLDSYQKLRREARYEGLSGRKLEQQKLNAMFEGVGGMKKARKYIRENDKRKGE